MPGSFYDATQRIGLTSWPRASEQLSIEALALLSCVRFARIAELPLTGICAPFVDPSLSFGDAPVFWLPEALGNVLRAAAVPSGSIGAALDLRTVPALRRVFIDDEGNSHINLQAGPLTLSLIVQGEDVLDRPVDIRVEVPLATMRSALPKLRLLDHLIRPGSPVPQPYRKATHGHQLLRHAIVAYDCDTAGLSHREIAAELFGERVATKDWGTSWLKQRVQRAIKRGRFYVSGGYRQLLR